MNSFAHTLQKHQKKGSALLAANFYNAETLLGVLRAAQVENLEVILQTSPSTLRYLGGARLARAMARAAAEEMGVKAWLHLDHATDFALIRSCVEAGYDSVMVDASDCCLEENMEKSKEVVEMAHAHQVLVEAELGVVPKLGEPNVEERQYTSSDEALEFVEVTGVDLLAIAIGTAHGFYKTKPKLALNRLEEIRAKISVPLVLHGGSNLAKDDWLACIQRGIVKINFATEIKDTFMHSLRSAFRNSDSIDPCVVFQPAIEAVSNLTAEKLRICKNQDKPSL